VVVAMMKVAHLRAVLPQRPVLRPARHLLANQQPSPPAVLMTWTTTFRSNIDFGGLTSKNSPFD
jgi:hypothetical protein